MSFFMEYPWAGNVRQLKHCIESAMNFTESGQWIGFSSLPPYLFDALMGDCNTEEAAEPFAVAPAETKSQPMETVASKEPSLMDEIHKEEKEALIAALREAKGNMAKAARILGINRQAVVYRVKKYGLK